MSLSERIRAVEPGCEACEVCGDATGRCAFGRPGGPCSCWQGRPCRPEWLRRQDERLAERGRVADHEVAP